MKEEKDTPVVEESGEVQETKYVPTAEEWEAFVKERNDLIGEYNKLVSRYRRLADLYNEMVDRYISGDVK